MKKQLATFALAILMGVLGFVVSGVAVAGNGKPPSPPGQEECEHGNAAKPCKDDPQPDKGKDCEEHGNQGGVNEDHCKADETVPPETETVDVCLNGVIVTLPKGAVDDGSCGIITTTTTETETTVTITESVPAEETVEETTEQVETIEAPVAEAPVAEEAPAAPEILAKPPIATSAKKQAEVLSVTTKAPKPTRQAQQAPFTL